MEVYHTHIRKPGSDALLGRPSCWIQREGAAFQRCKVGEWTRKGINQSSQSPRPDPPPHLRSPASQSCPTCSQPWSVPYSRAAQGWDSEQGVRPSATGEPRIPRLSPALGTRGCRKVLLVRGCDSTGTEALAKCCVFRLVGRFTLCERCFAFDVF